MIAPSEPIAGKPAMNEIEKRAQSYAELRDQLSAIITELNEKVESITREKMPLIKKLVGRSAEKHAELKSAIEASPELFAKPRTVVFHGIKCGFRKNEGHVEFDDAESVVKKIKQYFSNPENYLCIVEEPNKEALTTLSDNDLKRIGCRVTETGDEVIIKPTDSQVEKKVKALLKGALDESTEK
jgi:hypothetical protein